MYKTPGARCGAFFMSILHFLKIVLPIIAICMAWTRTCGRRSSSISVIHELSEIGLTHLKYHHDTAINQQTQHDGSTHVHNEWAKMQALKKGQSSKTG